MHFAASFVASIVLTTAICPLDVVLTSYQAGPSVLGRTFTGPLDCARQLVAEQGAAIVWRGWLPLWARFLPSSVLTFHIYEQSRYFLLGSYLD